MSLNTEKRANELLYDKLETELAQYIDKLCKMTAGEVVVHAYEKATGLTVKYEICPRRPGDIDECYADPTKAYTILGWQAKFDIEKMCADSANWQKKNPDGYGE
jgi:UDP-glucose 4-epimerase